MRILYICGSGQDCTFKGDGIYTLVSDEGEVLASHWCSNAGYARGDLHDTRPERIEKYKERFGEYQVMWIDDPKSPIKWDELLKLHKEFSDKHPEVDNSEDQCSITITTE